MGQPPQIESHDSLIELQALREGEGETPPLSEPEHAPTLEQITDTDFSGNLSEGEAIDLPHPSPRAKRPRKRSVIGVPGRQKVTLKMIKKVVRRINKRVHIAEKTLKPVPREYRAERAPDQVDNNDAPCLGPKEVWGGGETNPPRASTRTPLSKGIHIIILS